MNQAVKSLNAIQLYWAQPFQSQVLPVISKAATFGQTAFKPGEAKNTYGTGCFMLMNTGTEVVESHNRLLTTVGWQVNGRTSYMLEGSVFMGGAVVQWLRDGLGIIEKSADVQALAASVPAQMA